MKMKARLLRESVNCFSAVASLIIAFFFFSACGNQVGNSEADSAKAERPAVDCDNLRRTALRMDSILLQQTEIQETTAREGIKAFADFANFCPTDSLSPIYLIKCAQVARAINSIPQAKVVLEKCIADYPQFKDRAAAIFLLAQLYDEVIYLNDEQEAKKLYEQVLDEYPNSDWAYSAKGALNFIGKSDEEILRSLKKKK